MNTQTQEALKMAIEAMKITDEAFTEFSKGLVGLGIPASILRLDKQSVLIPAIQACKEALAQPAQEPVAWNEEEFNAIAYAYRTCPAHEVKMVSERYQDLVDYVLSFTPIASHSAQEPVAWATEWEDGEWSVSHSPNMGKQSIPLYTHPAPSWQGNKEFVGLSDLEISKIIGAEWWKEKHKFAKAIEAKLKELNHG